jgi:hypothetical protein
VTLQVPREVADQLLAMLATSLEVDDGGDMGDMDSDDFGEPPDGDEDDGFGMPPMGGDEGGDDDFFPGLGDEPDEDSDDDDDDDDDDGPSPPKRKGKGSDDEDSDDDDEDDEDTDEAADYGHSGGDPSGLRPQTALGESHIGFGKLRGQLSRKSGVRNPGALAASIGRKKYGAKGMAARSAAGRK